ncbi:MAG: aminotransferase class I/II-fold pyridoxal phosphate-dependent enzyme [Peptococcaceae bacterium]|jgi:cystathionine beta-lyase|nr:aminotransferase class I/II-fold pyridoxal phosphate-dependent enzyme [Peptococcaceae bacterium]
MDFNFPGPIERGIGAEKELITPPAFREMGIYPLRYAEMDYAIAPVIQAAWERRAQSGAHPYMLSDDQEYLETVKNWLLRRRRWEVATAWIAPCYGVAQTVISCLRLLTKRGDGVIIQPPVFHNYRKFISLNGRRVIGNPLIYHPGGYEMDLALLERQMADPANRLLILCHPHNPVNRVWPLADLEQIARLSRRYAMPVISDEVFAEQAFDHQPVPSYGSIPAGQPLAIVCASLGKAFNLCGGKHGNTVIPDKALREAFLRQRDADGYTSMDPFFFDAVKAAYSPAGEAWLDASIDYVGENVRELRDFLAARLPRVTFCPPQAGFFAWVDWRGLGLAEDELHRLLAEKALLLSDIGSKFGQEGAGFSRVVLGTPRQSLQTILRHLGAAAQELGWI